MVAIVAGNQHGGDINLISMAINLFDTYMVYGVGNTLVWYG